MDLEWRCDFPIENADIPTSYVSLLEGKINTEAVATTRENHGNPPWN